MLVKNTNMGEGLKFRLPPVLTFALVGVLQQQASLNQPAFVIFFTGNFASLSHHTPSLRTSRQD